MAMNGSKIVLLVEVDSEFVVVASQTGYSQDSERNLIEVGDKSSQHQKYIYGKQEDTLEIETMYVPDDDALKHIKEAQKNAEEVLLRRSENDEEVEEAPALIASVNIDAPDDDGATGSISFTLNDFWSEVTE